MTGCVMNFEKLACIA